METFFVILGQYQNYSKNFLADNADEADSADLETYLRNL